VLNDRNVTNSDQRLLCLTASIGSPDDLPRTGLLLTAALGHTGVERHISVNTARVASPSMMCTWTTNDDLRLRQRRRTATTELIRSPHSGATMQRHFMTASP